MNPRTTRTGWLVATLLVVSAGNLEGDDRLFALKACEDGSRCPTWRGLTVVPDASRILEQSRRLGLPLPDGTDLVVRRASLHRRADGGLSWHGEASGSGSPSGAVALTLHRGLISGAIFAGGATWLVEPLSGGSHVVRLAAWEDRGCGVGEIGPRPAVRINDARPKVMEKAVGLSQIDVLALYSAGARQGAGGVAQIEALILSAADLANLAFERSVVSAQLNVVHFAEIDLAKYGPLANLHDAVLALQADTEISALRNAWAADVVAAIFETGGGLCGYAHAMDDVGPAFASDAYSITVRDCAVANMTFAHEVGHNLGCRHNPESSDALPEDASFPWSFGHYVPGNYRTIMSLDTLCGPSGCPKLPNFSHPGISLTNSMALDPEPSGIAGERDNHQTLNATVSVVAGFRAGPAIFADGFETGDLSPWAP